MNEFEAAISQIDEWIGPNGVAGTAACVQFRGEIVAEHFAGEANPGVPVDEHTLFGLASVTKPITAATLMSCVEDGLLALDEPVARFVAEFLESADPDVSGYDPALEALRGQITLRQILSHLSGLPEDLPAGYLSMKSRPNLATYTDAMQRMPLQTAPGAELRYSNAGYAMVARVVERVTGADFWDEVDRRIIEPLGARDIVARPGPAINDRIATVSDVAREGTDTASYNSDYWRGLAIPWGGLFGSARDLVSFASAFLPGRETLLSPATAKTMITDQANGAAGGVGSLRLRWPRAYWGLGWEVRGDKTRHWTGDLASSATYCHFGAAGTLLWADPERDLAVALFANRTTIHLWPFSPPRWARLNNELIAIADRLTN
ncbi:serine hydrolase domain-containing protein [soil metagenome]